MSSTTTLEQSMSRVAMYLGSCLFHPNRSRGVSGWGDSYIIVECSLSLLTYESSQNSLTDEMKQMARFTEKACA